MPAESDDKALGSWVFGSGIPNFGTKSFNINGAKAMEPVRCRSSTIFVPESLPVTLAVPTTTKNSGKLIVCLSRLTLSCGAEIS